MKDIRHKGLNSAEVKRLKEHHEHRPVTLENDDVNVMICDTTFLQECEKNGNLRAVLHDLQFDMDPGHEDIINEKLDLGGGYRRFNYEKKDFETVKGHGKGSILIQGVR